jgi:hypothetical protein
MKITAGIIVLNGMPFLPYLLRNIYPVMDEIIIVEGAAESAQSIASPDGHSTDGTLAALKAMPDPERKIKLIQKTGFWPEKTEMSAAYAEACTGDFLWQMDVDEFYKPRDMLWIRDYLTRHPDTGAVTFKTLNFFGGMRGVVHGGWFFYGYDQFRRLFRWGPGFTYVTHRPPTVVDASGVNVRDYGVLHGGKLARQHGIYMYHYSYVTPAQVLDKMRYHQQYKKAGYQYTVDFLGWHRQHYERFTPWRVHPDQRPMSWLEPFRGQHPTIIQEMNVGDDHPQRPEIDRLLDSWWRWRLWKLIGTLDALLWWLYNRVLRPLLRPVVRPIRARFFGYDYGT